MDRRRPVVTNEAAAREHPTTRDCPGVSDTFSPTTPTPPTLKIKNLRYAGVCACGIELPAGARAGWDRSARRVVCQSCLSVATDAAPEAGAAAGTSTATDVAPEGSAGTVAQSGPSGIHSPEIATTDSATAYVGTLGHAGDAEQPVDVGRPGASLEQEYHRRKQAREERIRDKHPRLGRLILALSDEPASTKAFATGADGERRIAALLEKDCGEQVLFLHNRKLGHGRRDGDVDHIAIAPSGIYVIDAKRYQDAPVRLRRTGGLLSPVNEQLMVAGRDRTKLIDGCAKQLGAVVAALADGPGVEGVPVTALLCFVDADLPLWGDQEMRGVRLLGPRGTSKLLRRPGALTETERRSLHRHLAAALPPA
jgi:hypothetical protein